MLRDAVDRLRRDPELPVGEALSESAGDQERGDPPSFECQFDALADLCRQLTRRLGLLRSRLGPVEREQVRALLQDLQRVVAEFG